MGQIQISRIKLISKKFFYAFSLAALFFVSLGCQKRSDFQVKEWSAENGGIKPSIIRQNWRLESISQFKKNKIEFREGLLAGLPIQNSFLKTVTDSEGQDLYLAQGSFDSRNLSLSPLKKHIQQIQAKQILVSAMLKSRFSELASMTFEKSVLKIQFKQNQPELIWESIGYDTLGIYWQVDSDAEINQYQIKKVGSSFHDTVGTVYPLGPKKSQLMDVPLKNLKVSDDLLSDHLSISSASGQKIKNTQEPLKFNPGDEKFDQVQVFYTLNQALTWFQESMGFTPAAPIEIQLSTGYPEKTNSAFYFQNKIRFGTGDGESYDKIPWDPSIVTHETGHAVVESMAHLPFDGEGGSLNEAFADILAAIQLDNPNMGEVAYLKGPYKRTLENNFLWTEKNGSLYHDSLIISGLLWSLKKTLGGPRLVADVTEVLTYLHPRSDFVDFQKKFYQVLKNHYSGDQEAQLIQILKDRQWPEYK